MVVDTSCGRGARPVSKATREAELHGMKCRIRKRPYSSLSYNTVTAPPDKLGFGGLGRSNVAARVMDGHGVDPASPFPCRWQRDTPLRIATIGMQARYMGLHSRQCVAPAPPTRNGAGITYAAFSSTTIRFPFE